MPAARPVPRVAHVRVRSLLHPHPLRHPIRWWRLRHLRADVQAATDEIDGLIGEGKRREWDAQQDQAFM